MHALLWLFTAVYTVCNPSNAPEISYRISIGPTTDRTNLHVVMGFVGDETTREYLIQIYGRIHDLESPENRRKVARALQSSLNELARRFPQ